MTDVKVEQCAKPVNYTINITIHPGGNVILYVGGFANSRSGQKEVAEALRSAADMLSPVTPDRS